MKHLIKLLSVLLCIVLLLAACDKKSEEEETTANETDVFETVTETETETETMPETEPDTHPYVEPVLDNFFDFEYTENWATLDPDTLTRLDADAIYNVEHTYPLLIYVKRDVDVKNKVTETFTVYNLDLDRVVLEVSHSYTNGTYASYVRDYVPFDEKTGEPLYRYPESMMEVYADTLSNGASVFMICKYEFTVVDEAIREENPDSSYYEVKKTYTYYDAAGTLLTTTNYALGDAPEVAYDNYSTTYRFGTCNVAFDDETGLALSIVDASGVKQFGVYDVENALYGYILDRDTGTALSKQFLEVYEKRTGKLVQRYYYNPAADGVGARVLRNGDILIQEIDVLDEDSTVKPTFSFLDQGCTLATYILDAETGELTQVELNYVIYELVSREDFVEDYDLDQKGITLTENAVNVALAYPIDEKAQMRYDTPALLVLDNDLEIMFTLESIVLEQDMGRLQYGDLGIRALKDGYYLISLYTGAPAPHVIVDAKGEIVSYISGDMTVVDSYIITKDGIYNYEMKMQYEFSDSETLVGVVGHQVIFAHEQTVSILDNSEDASRYPYDYDDLEYTYNIYYTVDLTADYLHSTPLFNEGDNRYEIGEGDLYVSDEYGDDYKIDITYYRQKVEIQEITDDYVITYNHETGKFTMWNADLTHVLTTDESMNVISVDDGKYVITTRIVVGYEYDYDEYGIEIAYPVYKSIAYTVNE